MKFNEIFRKKLGESLIENKFLFRNDILNLINKEIEEWNKLILLEISDFYSPLCLDLENITNIINASFSLESNFHLQLRKTSWNVFRENEIKVEIIKKASLPLHSQEELYYRVERENLEYSCEDFFWSDKINLEKYLSISNFDCFLDVEFSCDKLSNYIDRGNIYNVNDWVNYLKELIEINFPDFVQLKSNNVLRYVKQLNNGLFFGFEFDEREIIKLFRKSLPSIPEYFNLILFNDNFTKKEEKYIFEYNENILSLGMLNNPFLKSCIPLRSFSTVELYHYGDFYPNNIEPKKVRDYVTINQDAIKLIHSIEYGEKLKKHAFYYMALLNFTSRMYLKYIEVCISDI